MIACLFWPQRKIEKKGMAAPSEPEKVPLKLPERQIPSPVPEALEEREWIKDRTFLQQLFSKEYLFLLPFLTIHLLWANFYMTSAEQRFRVMFNGNMKKVKWLLEFMNWALPASFPLAPVIGWVIDAYGVNLSILIVSFTALVYSAALFFTNTVIQSINFFIFSCYRAYLYSIVLSYQVKMYDKFPN